MILISYNNKFTCRFRLIAFYTVDCWKRAGWSVGRSIGTVSAGPSDFQLWFNRHLINWASGICEDRLGSHYFCELIEFAGWIYVLLKWWKRNMPHCLGAQLNKAAYWLCAFAFVHSHSKHPNRVKCAPSVNCNWLSPIINVIKGHIISVWVGFYWFKLIRKTNLNNSCVRMPIESKKKKEEKRKDL